MNFFKRVVGEKNSQAWNQFVKVAKPFWVGANKKISWPLMGGLLLLLVAVNGLNVVINFVSGAYMTALTSKNIPEFYRMLYIYAGVFVVGTPVVVFYTYVQQKLAMCWRLWLTEHMLGKYLANRSFYRLNASNDIDNPDERLQQDINTFTSSALNLLLVILGAVITFLSFFLILWSINRLLFAVVIFYSIGGTIVTIWYGMPLVKLNYQQLRKEADFRYNLVHVRKNVESIAFYQGEAEEGFQLRRRFAEVITNYSLLIAWQRNLSFFTTGFNYFVVVIPAVIIAPLFFAGRVEFGVLTRADMAFGQVLAALAVIVTSFQDISSFAAVVKRLGSFYDELETLPQSDPDQVITTVNSPDIALDAVTLLTPDRRQILVKDISARVTQGHNLLIVGASGSGKSSLLRAIAGLWNAGSGTIEHPALGEMMFLPQKPYTTLGSLRAQLLYPNANITVGDAELQAVLEQVNLGDLIARVGGLDAEESWSDLLSGGEQQRLAFARLLVHKPSYAVLDEATSGVDPNNETKLYQALQGTNTTYISVGHRPSLVAFHKEVLELMGDTTWRIMPADVYARSHS